MHLIILNDTHTHTHTLGRAPLMGDKSVTELSTWQHTTLTTDRQPLSQWNLKPQANGRKPTP